MKFRNLMHHSICVFFLSSFLTLTPLVSLTILMKPCNPLISQYVTCQVERIHMIRSRCLKKDTFCKLLRFPSFLIFKNVVSISLQQKVRINFKPFYSMQFLRGIWILPWSWEINHRSHVDLGNDNDLKEDGTKYSEHHLFISSVFLICAIEIVKTRNFTKESFVLLHCKESLHMYSTCSDWNLASFGDSSSPVVAMQNSVLCDLQPKVTCSKSRAKQKSRNYTWSLLSEKIKLGILL